MHSAQFVTPPREHREAPGKMKMKSHVRRSSRSPCTTSSTVLTWQSSPNNNNEYPVTPTRLDLSNCYIGRDDEHDESSVTCFGEWFLRKLFSPSAFSKTDVFSFINNDPFHPKDSQESFKVSRNSNTEDADHLQSTQKPNEITPTRLELAWHAHDSDIHDGHSCLSTSPQPASDSGFASEQKEDVEMVQLQTLLSMASRHEDDCSLNDAIVCLEKYLYQLHCLLPQTNTVFECRKAAALHKLGCLQWKCGRYHLSLFALIEAIALYDRLIEGLSSGNTPDVFTNMILASSHTLISKGRLHLSRGEGAAAMQCYHECVRRLSSIQSSSDKSEAPRIFSQACLGAGRVLLAQGKMKSSLKRFKRALKVQLGYQGTETPEEISALSFDAALVPLLDIAETLSHLGNLYETKNSLDQAMQCYMKSFQIYSTALGPNHVDTGEASFKLGRIHHRLDCSSEAKQAYRRAHQIFVNTFGENHRNSQAALLNLGMLYASRGRHKQALIMYHRVLQAQKTTFGVDTHPDLALTLHCIATSNEAIFKLEKAVQYYEEELRILEKTLHPYHLDIAKLLHHMAKVTMNAVDSKGNYIMLNESIRWLEKATEVYRHHNESNAFHNELRCLYASLRELRKRVV
ncbi:hypothetical protein HJC23_002730 [Cyclotella cryptica]|uniref:Kinesin light chain n=1 Tax=Cyclotella cryptica TaxID=29204 RepID=A0ABD3PQE9_9STRA|eukprot:CCRYP_012367-RB/>CCRYP_012367-RB protein AED:0.02 eAED:0.02 QI:663/1/1/1/1/1/2/62/628